MTNSTTSDILEWLEDHRATLGPNIRVNQLSSRRGATTYSVAGDDGKLLVKLAEPTTDETPANTNGLLREVAAIGAVDELRQRFQPALVTHHELVALVETWIEGTPAFKDVRKLVETGDEAALIDLLWCTLGALGLLHAHDWAHGDLQPLHFLRTERDAVLLDYGVAQSPAMPMEDYQGGMVHFNAPEIAAQIVSSGTAVATQCSDVFSLGAVFAFAVTGFVIGRYSKTASWQQKLEVLADGGLRLNELHQALADVPNVRRVLERLLDPDPDSRPEDAAAAIELLPILDS